MEPPIRTDAGLLFPPPPPLHHPSSLKPNRWGPYSSAKDFDANMATVVIVLVIAAILAFCILAAIRLLLRLHRRRRRPPPSPSKQTPQKAPSLADSLPSLVFSAGTQLAGAGAECAICLTEFADGDGVKVLPACNHGFHVKCVEAWLSSRSSCPTCRRCCRPVADPPERPPEEP